MSCASKHGKRNRTQRAGADCGVDNNKGPRREMAQLTPQYKKYVFALPAHSLCAHSWLFHSYHFVFAATDQYNSGHCSCSNLAAALPRSTFGQRHCRHEANRPSPRESGTLPRAAGLQGFTGWPFGGGKVSGDKWPYGWMCITSLEYYGLEIFTCLHV